MTHTVYMFTCTCNLSYVGSTKNFQRRKIFHNYRVKLHPLQKKNKHFIDHHSGKITPHVEYKIIKTNLTSKEAHELERETIIKFDTVNKGLNNNYPLNTSQYKNTNEYNTKYIKRQPFSCFCGITIKRGNKLGHLKTKAHAKSLANRLNQETLLNP